MIPPDLLVIDLALGSFDAGRPQVCCELPGVPQPQGLGVRV